MNAVKKINAQHPFMNSQVITNLSNGMTTTLKTMADIDVQFGKPFIDQNWNSPKEISVFLVLDTPEYKGKILFHFDVRVAKKIIEQMIGSAVDEDSPEILDGVGEISNIFYGVAKSKFKELGLDLNMSIPKPCLTKDLPKNISAHLVKMIIPFSVENKECFVEIILF